MLSKYEQIPDPTEKKKNHLLTAELLAKYMYYVYSREKLGSRADLGVPWPDASRWWMC